MSLNSYFTNMAVQAAYSCACRINGSRHLPLLRDLDKSQFYAPEKLRQIQLGKLRQLLVVALQHSPFWRRKFGQAGWERADLVNLESVEKLPVLLKGDIIRERDNIVVENVDRARLTLNKSGGTTGSPLSYYLDRRKIAVREAATLRHNLWCGFRIGHTLATIWGATADLAAPRSPKSSMREHFWGRRIVLDSSNICEQSLTGFIDSWKKIKPDILLGYSGALEYFTNYLKDNSVMLPPLKSIIASAEVLSPQARRGIEDFWGGPVYERYGCREVSVIASECPQHNGLHINAENLFLDFEIVEPLEGNRALAKIRITDLENLVFPFIRYELGDLVVINKMAGKCPCGRTLPLLEAVAGRISDYLKLSNGRLISGTGLTISLLSKAPGIMQTQIVQKSLQKIIIRIVKNEKFDENSLMILRREFAQLLGDTVQLDFEFPDNIERERSGKYRLVISEVMA